MLNEIETQLTPAEADSSQSGVEKLPKPERGAEIELHTHTLAFEGKAVARRSDGYVVFIEGALADETVRARILKAKSSFAEARLTEIVKPSPDRRESDCPDFGICGGCSMLHLRYDKQIFWKRQQVRETFERIGGFVDPPVTDTVGAPTEFHYRNKMEFSFSNERWLREEEIGSGTAADRFALGLHVRGRYDRVLDTKNCVIAHPITNAILDATRGFVREYDLGVFDADKAPDALLRFLVIRRSHSTGNVMVNLVTSRFEKRIAEAYAAMLHRQFPDISTVINNINSRRAQVAVGEKEYVITGSGFITDTLAGLEYRISANSFFQTNTTQAEQLYDIGLKFAGITSDDVVWDLYCGTGTITLAAAARAKFALGIELAESAVADAKQNAREHFITNVDFVASDMRKALVSQTLDTYPRPDVMIIDPPRSGMHGDVAQSVITLAPKRISYISCNPATQARDIALMKVKYRLVELCPVDMFPQTFHIETVARLERID